MNYISFPPGRNQFYFSEQLFGLKESVFWMYEPLTIKAKLIWYPILKSKWFRQLFRVSFDKLPSEIRDILEKLQIKNALVQINSGTKSRDQKTTLIVHNIKTSFFKIGITERSKNLIQNEYNALKLINDTCNLPSPLNYYTIGSLTILETEYVKARKLPQVAMDEKIFSMILSVSLMNSQKVNDHIVAYQHGDCCPWNVLLKENGAVVFIDWELAGNYPLGYDLFTYVIQPQFLLNPKASNKDVLNRNANWIRAYFEEFGIEDWMKYLKLFVAKKIRIESVKDENSGLYFKYKMLLEDLEKNRL